MTEDALTAEEAAKAAVAIERGRLLFTQECEFVMGVRTEADLPKAELPEVAFAGRSNVGKSSFLNALTNRNSLARTSNTPGRTREGNFFRLGVDGWRVDQSSRDANCSCFHCIPNKFLHLPQFILVRCPVNIADDEATHLSMPDRLHDIDRQSL